MCPMQGGVGIAIKDWGLIFFRKFRKACGGLSRYVIRGISIFGRWITIYGLII